MSKQYQSYLSTIIRGDFNIIEMRVLLNIVRRCRYIFYGKSISNILAGELKGSSLNTDFSLPFRKLMGNSHNYAALYKSLSHMQENWQVEYFDREKNIWCKSSWINNIVVDQGKGFVYFSCPSWLLVYILDCGKYGFRSYDFENAMSLSNPNAARLYLITASMSRPYRYDINQLKTILGLGNKYRTFTSFERRVLIPAMNELANKKFNGFSYQVKRLNGKYSKPMYIILSPVKREKNISDNDFKEEFKREVPTLVTAYLAQKMSFSYTELAANKDKLVEFVKLPNWDRKLIDIVERAKRKNKNHGYVFAAMMKEVILNKKED